MLGEKLGASAIPPQLEEDDIYTLPPKPLPSEFPDIKCLPSLDHAIYLFNAVKFHLGHTYRFFDDVEFERQIRNFYSGNAAQNAAEAPLWFAKFLLVLAFGTAFNPRPIGSREPPGGRFFVRAMALIPDPTGLWRDSLLAAEVLAMVGLYLFSIDERESAYVYVRNLGFYPNACIANSYSLATPSALHSLKAFTPNCPKRSSAQRR